jgi:hypothetical protein
MSYTSSILFFQADMEENFAANVEIKTPPRVPTLPKESYKNNAILHKK